jgi:hypothetical protein
MAAVIGLITEYRAQRFQEADLQRKVPPSSACHAVPADKERIIKAGNHRLQPTQPPFKLIERESFTAAPEQAANLTPFKASIEANWKKTRASPVLCASAGVSREGARRCAAIGEGTG